MIAKKKSKKKVMLAVVYLFSFHLTNDKKLNTGSSENVTMNLFCHHLTCPENNHSK